MNWKVVAGIIVFTVLWGIVGHYDYEDAVETQKQKEEIEKTAQAILDARALYPNSSLADLYDELTMPPELRNAHQANDVAVMEAYGFNWRGMTESQCVGELMKMYKELVD